MIPKRVRSILKLSAPLKWSYWTNLRVRLFRRELKAVRQSNYRYYPEHTEEESDYGC